LWTNNLFSLFITDLQWVGSFLQIILGGLDSRFEPRRTDGLENLNTSIVSLQRLLDQPDTFAPEII